MNEHTLYNLNRRDLLRGVLDRFGVRYRRDRDGNQKVSCINDTAHPNGDRNPSASVNLGKGLYYCFACGIRGDGYDLLRELEGWDAKKVNAAMGQGVAVEKKEDSWLI